MTLFELETELRDYLEAATDAGGELSEEAVAWFETIADNQAHKLESCACAIADMRMRAAAARAQAEQFEAKAASFERAEDRIKGLVLGFLERTGQKRATTSAGRVIRIQANGGVVPMQLADSIDTNSLPDRFKRVRVEPDTGALRAALMAGEDVGGVARLVERGVHLRIS